MPRGHKNRQLVRHILRGTTPRKNPRGGKGILGYPTQSDKAMHRLAAMPDRHPNRLSGAEKRRARKGGRAKGGPGGGGVQGELARLRKQHGPFAVLHKR